jgi:hypothetical protein
MNEIYVGRPRYRCKCGKEWFSFAGLRACRTHDRERAADNDRKVLCDLLARVRALEAYLNEKEGLILFPGGL